MYLAGKFVTSSTTKTITNPYNNEVIAEVAMAQRDELEQATQAAVDSFEACRALEPYQRADIYD
jgi:acyl-CoA reductase-like NAD-dependent aldehyde dehydrogenase